MLRILLSAQCAPTLFTHTVKYSHKHCFCVKVAGMCPSNMKKAIATVSFWKWKISLQCVDQGWEKVLHICLKPIFLIQMGRFYLLFGCCRLEQNRFKLKLGLWVDCSTSHDIEGTCCSELVWSQCWQRLCWQLRDRKNFCFENIWCQINWWETTL